MVLPSTTALLGRVLFLSESGSLHVSLCAEKKKKKRAFWVTFISTNALRELGGDASRRTLAEARLFGVSATGAARFASGRIL